MPDDKPASLPDPVALTGSMLDFARLSGRQLLDRTQPFEDWRQRRSRAGVWPFSRVIRAAPGPRMEIADEQGHRAAGVSLACQDYLGLTSHPAVREAAERALRDLGPHSAGSAALAGNTVLSLELEQALGQALEMEHVALFPTGWAAGYGAIAGLVRPDDHIVMDQLAHACLSQGAAAATRNVRRHRHLDVDGARAALREIRTDDARNGILVVTEGLFSMDSDVPDLGALQEVCREYDATLLVDVAHDYGSLGPSGGGSLAIQGLLGKVDLVMGSFSKTFASNGGFVASARASVRQYLKFYGSPQTFSNALSPVQAAVVLQALRIVRSPEGDTLRARLDQNARTLRGLLAARDIRCLGEPSAIVPAFIGNEAVGRVAWSKANQRGMHVNLVEFPAVAVGSARFRMQLMSTHREEELSQAAEVVAQCLAEAKEQLRDVSLPQRPRPPARAIGGDPSTLAKALPMLNPADLRKLLTRARTQNHPAGHVIVPGGSTCGALLVVQKGQVRLELEHQGQRIVMARFAEGEVIGEVSMLDGKGWSGSVIADSDTELACIDQACVARLAESEPDLGMRVYQSLAIVLAQRLRAQRPALVDRMALVSG